jgi:hypothetical protein
MTSSTPSGWRTCTHLQDATAGTGTGTGTGMVCMVGAVTRAGAGPPRMMAGRASTEPAPGSLLAAARALTYSWARSLFPHSARAGVGAKDRAR